MAKAQTPDPAARLLTTDEQTTLFHQGESQIMKPLAYLVRGILTAALVISIAMIISAEAPATQDPVKLSPQYYKVLLENDQVRVLEYRLKPGEKEPMHSHPAGIVHVLGGARLKFTFPDGRTEESNATAGETHWRDPVTHAGENTGTTEARALVVDLKNSR
jgi:quercetin dioxygenase-like cupin family protein